MILEKYLDSFYLELVYDNYKEEYINSIDITNFDKVYRFLQERGFYFINDIILNYLELFELDVDNIEKSLQELENELGPNYIHEIGTDMTLLNRVIDSTLKLEEDG